MKHILLIALILLAGPLYLLPGQTAVINAGHSVTFHGFYPEGICSVSMTANGSAYVFAIRSGGERIIDGIRMVCFAGRFPPRLGITVRAPGGFRLRERRLPRACR